MSPLGIHLNYFLFHMSKSPYIYYALQIGTAYLSCFTDEGNSVSEMTRF